MEEDQLRVLFESFDALGIPPTLDRGELLKAFRQQAMACHPDRHTTDAQKASAHFRFIRLCRARDNVIMAMEDSAFVAHLSADHHERSGHQQDRNHFDPATPSTGNAKGTSGRSDQSSVKPDDDRARRPRHDDRTASPSPGNLTQTDASKYAEEWEQFTRDATAYSRLFRSSAGIAGALISLLALWLVLLAGTTGILLLAALAALLVGLLSVFSISVPVIGWIFGVMALLGMVAEIFEFVAKRFARVATRIVRDSARTGFPFGAFAFALALSEGLSLLLCIYVQNSWSQDWRWLGILQFAVFSIGLALLYYQLARRLQEIGAAFGQIRKRIFTDLMVLDARAPVYLPLDGA